jgi:hypothetical protein
MGRVSRVASLEKIVDEFPRNSGYLKFDTIDEIQKFATRWLSVLQSRTSQHGQRRHHTDTEIGHGRLTSTFAAHSKWGDYHFMF